MKLKAVSCFFGTHKCFHLSELLCLQPQAVQTGAGNKLLIREMPQSRESLLVLLPQESLSSVWGTVLATLTIMVPLTHLEWVSFYKQATSTALGLSFGMVLNSLCLLAEEYFCHTKYRNKRFREYDAFICKASFGIILVLLIVCTGGVQLEKTEWLSVVVKSSIFMLLKSFGVLGPVPAEVSQICEQRKTDVACGLAWSFYTGYLKLVLPRLGASIEEYHAQNRNRNILTHRDSWRIHILVPLSASVSDQLEDMDQRIQFYDNLPEMVIDRAGVRRRVYKHSVHAVYDDKGQAHYCVVEYATPLHTLHQMSHDSSVGFGVKERYQQVLLFYRTLKEILDNSPECRNRYQLILLDDDSDTDPDPHFLSKELLKYVEQPEREVFCGAPIKDRMPQMESDLQGATELILVPCIRQQPRAAVTVVRGQRTETGEFLIYL
ncbi:stimulator of interferon genes protein [Arapaima gigas]